MSTVLYPTKRCFHCGSTGLISMTAEERDYATARLAEGAYVQDAFPSLSAPLREQIISGTHPDCWTEMFGMSDEDEEEMV